MLYPGPYGVGVLLELLEARCDVAAKRRDEALAAYQSAVKALRK